MQTHQLFIIQKDQTSLSAIVNEAGLDTTTEQVWNHELNRSLREHSDWPEGAVDMEKLPVGYGIYLPGFESHYCIVDPDKPTTTFVCRSRLKDLRFSVNYYREYKTVDWRELDAEQVQTDCSMVVTEFRPSNAAFIPATGGSPIGSLAAGAIRLKTELAVYEANRKKKRPRHCVPPGGLIC